jgi:serine/threonine protein kinase
LHSAISEQNHSHLIPALLSYELLPDPTVKEKVHRYFLIFPWAEYGDLDNFWKTRGHIKKSPEVAYWMLIQMCGVMHALVTLHNYDKDNPTRLGPQKGCRHGDLKPDNILVFPEASSPPPLGTLVIADLGLARFHDMGTLANIQKSFSPSGTQRFGPPEAPTNETWRLSRRYDVWSMGGIMLDFLIWFLFGPEGRSTFMSATSRTLYDTVEPKKLDKAVLQIFQSLEEDGRCAAGNTAFGDVLDVIKNRMLVHKMFDEDNTADRLRPHPLPRTLTNLRETADCRARSTEVYQKLVGVCERAALDRDYLLGNETLPVQFPDLGFHATTGPNGSGSSHADDELEESVST